MSDDETLDEHTQKHIGSLIESLQELLGRFANEDGVTVEYNTEKRHLIRFNFRTTDNFAMKVPFDLNQTSNEYINSMLKEVVEQLYRARESRHDNPIVVSGGL